MLARDVKSCRGIRSSAIDTCHSRFHLRVRAVSVCIVGSGEGAGCRGFCGTGCCTEGCQHARSVRGSMVGTGLRSVRGVFTRRWGSGVGDIFQRCRPRGSVGWLSSLAWKVTRPAAEGGVRPWCWVFADLLVPRGGCGVRGEWCPAVPPGACWSLCLRRGRANGRSQLRCGSYGGAIPVGRLCGLCKWPVRATCLGGNTREAEMRSYGLATLAPLATTHPSPPLGRTGDPDVTGRRTRPSPRRTFRSKAQSRIPKTCVSEPRSSQKLYYSQLSSILKSGRVYAHQEGVQK